MAKIGHKLLHKILAILGNCPPRGYHFLEFLFELGQYLAPERLEKLHVCRVQRLAVTQMVTVMVIVTLMVMVAMMVMVMVMVATMVDKSDSASNGD